MSLLEVSTSMLLPVLLSSMLSPVSSISCDVVAAVLNKNNDKYLTKEEVLDQERQWEVMVKVVDTNMDGEMSVEEFAELFAKGGPSSCTNERRETSCYDVAAILDENQDGRVTSNELTVGSVTMGLEK